MCCTSLPHRVFVSIQVRRQWWLMGMRRQAAIFNASGKFVRKPFLELSPSDFATGYAVSGHGAFLFSQSTLPLLLRSVDQSPQHPPTLIFTGATASLKGGAQMSSFAAGKFALRALAQSLGREFGPKGVHVAHAIIDGVIDIPRTKEWLQGAGPDAKISADAVSMRWERGLLRRLLTFVGGGQIADAYWFLHTQHRSCFTNEIDIRPFVEKW